MVVEGLPRSLGEFRVEGLLGEGGSGVVYDATWGPRRVALKVMHASLADSERVRAQFLAEAQRLQGIAHPAVVKVLAVGALPDGRPFLAMERLDGETLAHVLANGPMGVPQALDLFAELCAAVGTLHAQGLIHRDLKPENVFIVGGVHAVLLDFGIAKEVAAPASTTTMDGGVRGTPAYMAPERFFGQPAAIATDIYELAVTLYAMLAGRLPWDDLGDPEARLSPRPLVELADVPEELDVEIRRALSTRAQNRPASAAELLAAVRAAAEHGGTISASAPKQPSETARMRPAGGGEARKPTVTAEAKPWFAERQATTDRGKTPLAWAPDKPAPAAPPAKRWPLVLGGAAMVAALGGGIAYWRLRGKPAGDAPDLGRADITPASTLPAPVGPGQLAPDQDPWASGPVAPTGSTPASERGATTASALPTSGPEVSAKRAQQELAAALPHLPGDTSFVAAGLIGQLRRDDRFAAMWAKLAGYSQVQLAEATLPPCVITLVKDSEWFAFGSTGFMADKQGTLIVRGRWQRADVERCFAGQSQDLQMTDGAHLLQLPEVGWLDFLDGNTVYISVRQDLAAAQVHDNVKKARGLTTHARELLATLPADRAVTFVVDGTGNVRWPSDPLPPGSDAAAWVAVSDWGVAFQLVTDVHAEAAAKQLETKLHDLVDPAFGKASESVGKITVSRAKATVTVAGKLSTLMLGLVSSSLASSP